MIRVSGIMCSLGLACASLFGCADSPCGRNGASVAYRPSLDRCPKMKQLPPISTLNGRKVLTELLRKKLEVWPAGSGTPLSVRALIVDNRGLPARPAPPEPDWGEWEDTGPNGHFSADWIGGQGGLWAVVRFRSPGRDPIGLGRLLFVWRGSRWRFAWPKGWTSRDRQKYRRFIALYLAGKLPSTAAGIDNLLPGPAKLFPMHIKLKVEVGPSAPCTQKNKQNRIPKD